MGSQPLGQGPDQRVEQHEPSHHGDEEEEGDRFLRHHRLPGGASRSASRCLASSRSAKSMRSLNSLTSVRSPCTSPTTSERSASSSARTSSGSAAPPWRLIRSATALPTGEMASRNRVPPRSEEHTSELQSHSDLVCRLLLEKKKNTRAKAQ